MDLSVLTCTTRGNLARHNFIQKRTSTDVLRRKFERYGEIGDAYIPRDRSTGESRGFGFVRFRDKRDASDAIKGMDGYEMDGRELRVDYARHERPAARPRESRRRSRSRSRDRRRSRSRDRRRSRSRSGGRSRRSRSRSGRRSRDRRSRSKSDRSGSRDRKSKSGSPQRDRSRSRGRDRSGSRDKSRSRSGSR